jgi:quercetin dioxygenase-like cupin family protein
MPNFYDAWLDMWNKSEREKAQARKYIHEEELEWVETKQDERSALVVAPETGFRTWGTVTMVSEISPGRHTGAHKHGEESILILGGSGYSVIDDIRYDWKKHSLINIPFGSVHQHFNTSGETVRYLSVMVPHLEHFCGLHRTIQVEPWGPISAEGDYEVSADGMGPDGHRVVLHREDATLKAGEGDGVPVLPANMPDFDPEHPLILGDLDGMHALPDGFHKSKIIQYMRIGKDLNDFAMHTTEISGLLIDPPHEYGGMHAHMEAHLYCLQGTGYTLVDGVKVPWKPGTGFHVPGPQTPHRHVNEGDVECELVRIAFGIRYFWERAAKREFPYLYLSPRQAVLEKNIQGAGRMP